MTCKILKKTASAFMLVVFISTNSIYAAPDYGAIFKNKKASCQKLRIPLTFDKNNSKDPKEISSVDIAALLENPEKPINVVISYPGETERQIIWEWAQGRLPNVNIVGIAGDSKKFSLGTVKEMLSKSTRYGNAPVEVKIENGALMFGNKRVPFFTGEELPWHDIAVDVVLDGSDRGIDQRKDTLEYHIKSGARRVIASPSTYAPALSIALVFSVLDSTFGIVKADAVPVVSINREQQLIMDAKHPWTITEGRAAALNIVPAGDKMAAATSQLLGDLDGRLTVSLMHVPVNNGSIVPMAIKLNRTTSKEEVNNALRSASEGELRGVLGYYSEKEVPLVSSDILGRQEIAIVDASLTQVIGDFAIVYFWFDGQSGFAKNSPRFLNWALNHQEANSLSPRLARKLPPKVENPKWAPELGEILSPVKSRTVPKGTIHVQTEKRQVKVLPKGKAARVAIAGAGRTGNQVEQAALFFEDPDLDILVLQGVDDINELLERLKFDSAHGGAKGGILSGEEASGMILQQIKSEKEAKEKRGRIKDIYFPGISKLVANKELPSDPLEIELYVPGTKKAYPVTQFLFANRKPTLVLGKFKERSALPWRHLKIDIVIEASGLGKKDARNVMRHLEAGAKKVVITDPGKSSDDIADIYDMVVVPVNAPKRGARIISNASCTTNGVATGVKVLVDRFGLVAVFLTTIHGPTGNERDRKEGDAKGRSSEDNIKPAITGAAKATSMVIPEVKGKFDGIALRIPVPNASCAILWGWLNKDANIDEVNSALRDSGIVGWVEDWTSQQVNDTYTPSIADAGLTVTNGRLVRVVLWYDNESGYSRGVGDTAVLAAIPLYYEGDPAGEKEAIERFADRIMQRVVVGSPGNYPALFAKPRVNPIELMPQLLEHLRRDTEGLAPHSLGAATASDFIQSTRRHDIDSGV